MPFGDRTGPLGYGPMTGRGAGYCAGYGVPGYMNPVPRGFGLGFGRGFERGFRRFFYGRPYAWRVPIRATMPQQIPVQNYQEQQYTKEDELADLKAEKESVERDIELMKKDLKAIEERIKELEKR